MAAGLLASLTFTPGSDGQCNALAVFEAEATGSDWGANVKIDLRQTQSGTTTTLETVQPGASRARYAMQSLQFAVSAGVSVTVDLYMTVSGASAGTAYNLRLHAEVIKR